jgi:hypothetical protein
LKRFPRVSRSQNYGPRVFSTLKRATGDLRPET